jgi:hypothetical protein
MSSFPGNSYGALLPSPISSPARPRVRSAEFLRGHGTGNSVASHQGNAGACNKFVEAIGVVYSTASDNNNKAAANTWLQTFSTGPLAWDVCQQVISTATNQSPEICFFTINMFYRKIKREWMSLDDGMKSKLQSWLLGIIKSVATDGSGTFDQNSTARLCLCLAAVASYMPGGVSSVVQFGLGVVQQQPNGVVVAIELITGVADEVKEADAVREKSLNLQFEVKKALPDVIRLCSFLLIAEQSPISLSKMGALFQPTSQQQGGGRAIKLVINCISRWSLVGLTVSTLRTDYFDLFNGLVSVLMTGPPPLLEVTVDAFCNMLSVSSYPRGSGQNDGVAKLSSACVQSRARFQKAVADDDENTCRQICRLASAIGEHETDLVARGEGEMLKLVHLIFEFLSCTKMREVAIITLDFWINLCDIEVQQRHPSLRQEAFVSLVTTVVSQASYPEEMLPLSATEFEEGLLDDDFGPFRVGTGGKEMLVFAFYLLKSNYFKIVLKTLGDSQGNWHNVEGVLWALTAVAREATKGIKQNPVDAENREIVNLLVQVLNEINTNQAYISNPAVAKMACKLINALTPSFIKIGYAPTNITSQHLMQPSLSFLCNALMIKGARLTAATVMKSVGAATLSLLANQSAMEHLVNVLRNAISRGLELQGQRDMVDILARIALQISDTNVAKLCFGAVLNPFCTECAASLLTIQNKGGQFLSSNEGPTTLANIAGYFQILRVGIQHLDSFFPRFVAKGHAIAGELVQRVWPMVNSAVQMLFEETGVLRPGFQLMSRIVLSFGNSLQAQFHELIKLLEKSFIHNPSHFEIETATLLIDVFGAHYPDAFRDFMVVLTPTAVRTLNQDGGSGVHRFPDFVRTYYEFSQRLITFCPGAFEANVELGATVFELAIVCGRGQERDGTRNTLNFINQLIKKKLGYAEAIMTRHSITLIKSTLHCIVESSPDFLIPFHAQILYTVLETYPQHFEHAAVNFFAGLQNNKLALESKRNIVLLFQKLAGPNNQISEGKKKITFKAFCKDLSSVARGEAQHDILQNYI